MSSTFSSPLPEPASGAHVGQARTDQHRTALAAAPSFEVESAPEQPFTGTLRQLSRGGMVQPGTVAVLFPPGRPIELRYPGDTLSAGWRPFRPPIDVLPVNTARIGLHAIVTGLTTFDDYPVDEVALKVVVQLASADGYRVVLQLVERHGPSFGAYLMEQLQTRIESSVQGAFRLNNLSVLRRRLASLLEERWLPPTFAEGALVRSGFTVSQVRWPSGGDLTFGRPRPAAPEPTISQFELSVDARLRRLWAARCPMSLAGIASADSDGNAFVVASAEEAPEPVEIEHLQQAFAELIGIDKLTLVVTGARDYAEVVRAWVEQVSGGRAHLIGVDLMRATDTLRVHVSKSMATTPEAAFEALRRLLPQRRIEFEALMGR